MNLTFEQVKKNDDYEKIAELIYYTDPYLYPDLFGNLEQAKKLVPILLNDSKSTFYRKRFYSAKLDGKIVGIVSMLPHDIEWNFDSIRMAYMECGLPLNEAVKAASSYFNDSFSKIGVGASACNVSVDSKYRHRGIGKFLFENLVIICGRNNIELSVLKENESAINLYKRYGFTIIDERFEYGGYLKPEVLCYLMVRLSN